MLTFEKIKRRIKGEIVSRLRPLSWYPWIYPSMWHATIVKIKQAQKLDAYFTAVPNRGAGIGHQMANWIAGYWFAQKFGLKFAHIPFSSPKWESLLGFGFGEEKLPDLVAKGYKTVTIPLFDEKSDLEMNRIRKIVASYAGKKVVFVCEQDQGYADQYGVREAIQEKFYRVDSRESEKLIYNKECFNIAIHVRRGDIVAGAESGDANMLLRWQNTDYFETVLTQVLASIQVSKPVAIYLFSQGSREEFASFEKFSNLYWCLDMGAQDSFLHMVAADLLITSKSSFSYKPALLSRGIKVCPRNFWHGYPDAQDWVLVGDDGLIKDAEIQKLRVNA